MAKLLLPSPEVVRELQDKPKLVLQNGILQPAEPVTPETVQILHNLREAEQYAQFMKQLRS